MNINGYNQNHNNFQKLTYKGQGSNILLKGRKRKLHKKTEQDLHNNWIKCSQRKLEKHNKQLFLR